MPGSGVLFALNSVEEAQLLSRQDARARASWCANELEERWDRDWLVALDDKWFAVHYCLHGASGFPNPGSPPEACAIFGGQALGVPGLYSIDYKPGALAQRIASALGKMRDEAIWARAGLIERPIYDGAKGPDVQAGVVDVVHELKAFYKTAADAGRAVIFTVDL